MYAQAHVLSAIINDPVRAANVLAILCIGTLQIIILIIIIIIILLYRYYIVLTPRVSARASHYL